MKPYTITAGNGESLETQLASQGVSFDIDLIRGLDNDIKQAQDLRARGYSFPVINIFRQAETKAKRHVNRLLANNID